jgi:exonuclease V gamma subunit
VHHLALQLAARETPELPRHSRLLTLDGVAGLRPIDQPERHLSYLLALWKRGQRELLPFFPNTAYGYAAEKGNWQAEWSSDQPGCESSDPWFDLAFRAVNPLMDEFASLAYDVFAPILGAMEDGR